MDNPRLLTEQEIDSLSDIHENPDHWIPGLLKAQDRKTSALVEAATLRAVGEWLMTKDNNGPWLHVPIQEIEALREGKMPEGWGK